MRREPSLGHLLRASPTAPVAAAIAVAFVLAVIGDIIVTFQTTKAVATSPRDILLPLLQFKSNALTGRDRVLQFFDFGSPLWAIALLVAVILLVAGPRLATRAGAEESPPRLLLLVLAALSALVVVASVVNLAVWFSYFGRSVSLGFKGVLTELAAVAIALATARWAAMAAGMAVGQRGSAEVGAVPSDRPGGATADPSDRPGGAAAWGPGSTDPTTGFQAPHDSGRDTPPAGGGYQPPV